MRQIPTINQATGDYVLAVIAGNTYQHKETLKQHGFYFSPNQGDGIGPGWNSAPFRLSQLETAAAKQFIALTKELAEQGAAVTVYLMNA